MSIQTRLQQLLKSLRQLFKRAAEDPPPQPDSYDQPVDTNDTESEQHDTATSGNSTGSTDDSTGSDTDSQPATTSEDDPGGEEVDIEWPPWPTTPCVGQELPEWPEKEVPQPTPPDNPKATITGKIWPIEGNTDLQAGCEMAAQHLEYALLKSYGDQYDAHVEVSETVVPRGVRDRASFKDWVTTVSDEPPAQHINTHVSSRGPPGSACCGFGSITIRELFDGVSWNPEDGDCVKRRRWGQAAYAVQQILHESFHQLGISHMKREVEVRGDMHSTVMGATYTSSKESGWHLYELHPADDPYDGFELFDAKAQWDGK